MSRRIKESHLAAILQRNAISTDMLSDTSGLTGYHVGITDMVKQRGLTVVYVTHYGHNRRTTNEIVLVILLFANGFLYLGAHVFGLDRKSTRLNSSHANISYAVFCLKK